MTEADKNIWKPVIKNPENNGAYICDFGGRYPAVLLFIDGHWYSQDDASNQKDNWVKHWTDCPKQIRP